MQPPRLYHRLVPTKPDDDLSWDGIW
jgi:hypothetical protein